MPGVQRPPGQRRHPGGRAARLSADPVTVDVERERGVTITWDDGRVSRYGLEDLRANCLCAACRGRRDQGLDAWSPAPGAPALRIESAREVGNWGLNLLWNDGHGTGIYTWEILRAWDEPPANPTPNR